MRSLIVPLLVVATSAASNTICAENEHGEDEHSLLQARSLTSKKKTFDSTALLENVKRLAQHSQRQTPESVADAVDAVKITLQQMEPLLETQHDEAQSQIDAQVEDIQACSTNADHGTAARDNYAGELTVMTQCMADQTAADDAQQTACNAWHTHIDGLDLPSCNTPDSREEKFTVITHLHSWVESQWETTNSLRQGCNDATSTASAEEERCAPVIADYDDMFCQHQISCTLLTACHDHEVERYEEMRVASREAVQDRQQQFRVIVQVRCILDLITEAVHSNATIEDSNFVTCEDEANVDHLTLSFPEVETPSACPTQEMSDPECTAVQLPLTWEDGVAQESFITEDLSTTNIALHKPVSMSTITGWGGPLTTTDGNTNNNVVSHTANEHNAWIEVDLEDEFVLSRVVVWNGWEHCCRDRINPYVVIFKDAHNNEVARTEPLRMDPGNVHEAMEVSVPTTQPVRHVRVQLADHSNYLHIAELQAFGVDNHVVGIRPAPGNDQAVPRDGLVSWYKPEDFDVSSGQWPEHTGNGVARVSSGALTVVQEEDGPALHGTTSTRVEFGDVISSTFTIASVARYTGGTRGRILQGGGGNWLHGHWGGRTCQAYYQGWITDHESRAGLDDWHVMIGQNSEGRDMRVGNVMRCDGNDVRVTGHSGITASGLFINGGSYSGEVSNFAIREVITWNRALSEAEIDAVNEYLR